MDNPSPILTGSKISQRPGSNQGEMYHQSPGQPSDKRWSGYLQQPNITVSPYVQPTPQYVQPFYGAPGPGPILAEPDNQALWQSTLVAGRGTTYHVTVRYLNRHDCLVYRHCSNNTPVVDVCIRVQCWKRKGRSARRRGSMLSRAFDCPSVGF